MSNLLKTIPCVLLALILVSCVTPQSHQSSNEPVNFKKYEKVKLVITDAVNTPYSANGLPMFEGLLKGKLRSIGYNVVESNEDMRLEINVNGLKPGNRALRTLVGFGAGRAVFTYVADFKEKDGRSITTLDGGKAYHGLEIADNPLYKSDEEILMGMFEQSVIQIGDFIRNNGTL